MDSKLCITLVVCCFCVGVPGETGLVVEGEALYVLAMSEHRSWDWILLRSLGTGLCGSLSTVSTYIFECDGLARKGAVRVRVLLLTH